MQAAEYATIVYATYIYNYIECAVYCYILICNNLWSYHPAVLAYFQSLDTDEL